MPPSPSAGTDDLDNNAAAASIAFREFLADLKTERVTVHKENCRTELAPINVLWLSSMLNLPFLSSFIRSHLTLPSSNTKKGTPKMVLLRSMHFHPSVFAQLLLQLLVVCLLSLPKPGHCDFMWNVWTCLQSTGNPNEDEGFCVSTVLEPSFIDTERAKFDLPKADRNWTCTCQLGALYGEMGNANIVNPNPALRPTPKMKCKYRIESEDVELNEKQNTKEEKECENNEMKCGLALCKANDSELVFNHWSCFPADLKKKACAKNAANRTNEMRAKWGDSKLANATTDWKCRCRFGANGTDMGNAKFVSSAPVPTNVRHGNGGMALVVVGLILAFWPLFHAAPLKNC
ncbi:hypothetical protein niasHT_003648 [Heterodera trifolii]|uniref:Uncharacterized protein n=1 Tax=Heterodera trifolii TaxID=157864 RepID=A0ABD2MEU2_9BILA